MSGSGYELRSLARIGLTGYLLAFAVGLVGSMLEQNSYVQLLMFQVGDACGITSSVIAARYIGLRNQQVAASAFILMGITHGISLAGAGVESLNQEKSITLILPMVPAMLLMLWCTMFPMWLRVIALLPALLFVIVYARVLSGLPYFDWPTTAAYVLWNMVEVCWGVIMLRDHQRQTARVPAAS
jgi:hypothetical protein